MFTDIDQKIDAVLKLLTDIYLAQPFKLVVENGHLDRKILWQGNSEEIYKQGQEILQYLRQERLKYEIQG
jgi:hypothetical protein